MRRRTMMGAVMATLLLAVASSASPRAAEPVDPTGAVLAEYGRIHQALASDRLDGVTDAAARIAELAKQADGGTAGQEAWSRLAKAAEAMNGTAIGQVRGQLMELSRAAAAVVGVSGNAEVDLYYCPMVEAYWLQRKSDPEMRNPYYGKSMLRCGEKVARVED